VIRKRNRKNAVLITNHQENRLAVQ